MNKTGFDKLTLNLFTLKKQDKLEKCKRKT